MTGNVGYLGKAPWNKDPINNPEDLWAAATRYVEWSYSSPLVEAKLFSTKTGLLEGSLDKLRPLTLEAF